MQGACGIWELRGHGRSDNHAQGIKCAQNLGETKMILLRAGNQHGTIALQFGCTVKSMLEAANKTQMDVYPAMKAAEQPVENKK